MMSIVRLKKVFCTTKAGVFDCFKILERPKPAILLLDVAITTVGAIARCFTAQFTEQ